MKDKLIAKVYKNKKTGQKLVTIPKDSKIKAGSYIIISQMSLEKDNESLNNN